MLPANPVTCNIRHLGGNRALTEFPCKHHPPMFSPGEVHLPSNTPPDIGEILVAVGGWQGTASPAFFRRRPNRADIRHRPTNYVEGEAIVTFKPSVGLASARQALSAH